MVDLRAATLTGGNTTLREAAVEEFKKSLRGELVLPGDPGYNEARALWNAMIDKRPALIARCAGVSDVIQSVNFARAHNLLTAVRGGGHSVPGNSVCDGGIMIDLSRMKSVRVNPANRTARAEPGVKWVEFDRETQAFGLATTGGTVSDTGIAGLTLGGGLGWLGRKHGPTVDNLLSVDIVTADGQFQTASAAENPDLFWGVRGGGGNFGIVTSFQYRLHPVGPTVQGGMAIYPLEKAREGLRFFQEYAGTAPDELMVGAFLLTAPDGAPLFAIGACYSGPLEDGEAVLRPIKQFGPPVVDLMGPMPYLAVQSMLDASASAGRRNHFKANFMNELDADAIETLLDRFATVPSPASVLALFQLGGEAARVGPQETAFPHRDAHYNFIVLSMWDNPADDRKNMDWSRGTWDAMRPFYSTGVYVNEMGDDAESQARVPDAYGANYRRLAALKKKYDPVNLFRLNPNIKPAP